MMAVVVKWRIVTATLAVSALGLVTACSSQSESSPPALGVSSETGATNVGTGGALIPIESSNVSMAGYDASTQVMTVLFDSGGLYEYYAVPQRLWDDFVAAQPSPWGQVGYPQLVQGGYQYRKVAP